MLSEDVLQHERVEASLPDQANPSGGFLVVLQNEKWLSPRMLFS
jgi:hypothetical protein